MFFCVFFVYCVLVFLGNDNCMFRCVIFWLLFGRCNVWEVNGMVGCSIKFEVFFFFKVRVGFNIWILLNDEDLLRDICLCYMYGYFIVWCDGSIDKCICIFYKKN